MADEKHSADMEAARDNAAGEELRQEALTAPIGEKPPTTNDAEAEAKKEETTTNTSSPVEKDTLAVPGDASKEAHTDPPSSSSSQDAIDGKPDDEEYIQSVGVKGGRWLGSDRVEDWDEWKQAFKIVEQVWEMMDEGREEETWDWESIIARRGWDFLVT